MERKRSQGFVVMARVLCALAVFGLLAPAAFAQEYPTDYPMNRWIVGFKTELKMADNASGRAAQVRNAGATVMRDLPRSRAVAIRGNQRALRALRNNPNIAYVERDEPRFPMAQSVPYGIPSIQADQVPLGPNSRKVCIIDSGYDLGHPDLGTSNVSGHTGQANLPWDQDGFGHGTHVAGTISALNNSEGVIGVAPGIDLYIVRVFDDNANWTFTSNLITAADLCANAGADVINMSLGCRGGCPPNAAEDAAFTNLWSQGIVNVAAAGNDGNSNISHPASYASVISVAAVDELDGHGDFSQTNQFVELAAPGVLVQSSLPRGQGSNESASVDGTGYPAIALTDSPNATGSGNLADCGFGDSVCTGVNGGVCLIERGSVSFADKAINCEAGGGNAAIIFNNAPGNFQGTLGGAAISIPVVAISQADGQFLRGNKLGSASTVTAGGPGDYAFWDGTSMATPHVAGAVALLWSYDTSWTNDEIRGCLAETALDLGDAGRDDFFGHGKIQVQAALAGLQNGTCGAAPPPPPPPMCMAVGASCSVNSDCCSNKCKGKFGSRTCK